ncbi:hypothetical protein JXM83_01830 [Candidatus Woesearchaeota archaeon]|nr:hypothetical protein [Candidatus Woesearchaeota archaeon]
MDYVPPPDYGIEYVIPDKELRELRPSFVDFIPAQNLLRPKIGLELILLNDNRILTNDCFFHFLKNYGDDFGFTHGFDFKFLLDLPENLYLTVSGGSNLYSRFLNLGPTELSRYQLFVNENFIKATLDNNDSNKFLTDSFDLGFHVFQSINPDSLFSASSQQINWHEFLNDSNISQIDVPIDVIQDYFKSGFFVGYHKNFNYPVFLSSDFLMKLFVSAGGIVSSIEGASFFDFGFSISLGYQKSSDSFGFLITGSASLQLNDAGQGGLLEANLVLGDKTFSTQLGIRRKFGEAIPVRLYDENFEIEHYLGFKVSL